MSISVLHFQNRCETSHQKCSRRGFRMWWEGSRDTRVASRGPTLQLCTSASAHESAMKGPAAYIHMQTWAWRQCAKQREMDAMPCLIGMQFKVCRTYASMHNKMINSARTELNGQMNRVDAHAKAPIKALGGFYPAAPRWQEFTWEGSPWVWRCHNL